MLAWTLWLALQDWDRLVQGLGAPDIEERESAERQLRNAGSEAFPALERALSHADPEVRGRARAVLQALNAPSLLIEDLRSDDTPGNAKTARNRLIRNYGGPARAALLRGVRSDDDQQMIQSAFVLAAMGDGRAALAAAPDLLRRIVAAYFRDECEDYRWVAVHALLRFSPLLSDRDRRESFARAFRGVPPHAMESNLLLIRDVARQLQLPFPRPILDRYLLCLRDNNRAEDAFYCRLRVRSLEAAAVPSLRERLSDPDPQMRRFAAELLLEMGAEDLPPCSLVELLQWRPSMRSRIVALGRSAIRDLDLAMGSRDRAYAIRAAHALAEIDPSHPGLCDMALVHFGTDPFRDNGIEAVDVIVLVGESAVSKLRARLVSEDEQETVLATLALSRLGKLGPLDEGAWCRLGRFAAANHVDESAAVEALLRQQPELWEGLGARLRRMGNRGRIRATLLEESLAAKR